MGKNAHPPRNNGKKKATPQEPQAGQNTASSSDKGDKKSRVPKSKAPEQPPQDVPKRPDTRTLIGGSSWTGKLPVNLLSEHCQKQHWEKPEYTMSKSPEGFTSSVILKCKNPKTQEISVLPPFRPPASYSFLAPQATAVEARHLAATYALFRVSSMKNISMVLPPAYRDIWKELEAMKAQESADKAWMYAADPFLAHQEREQSRAKAAERREKEQKDVQASGKGGEPSLPVSGSGPWREWKTAPRIEMGSKTRRNVEKVVRQLAKWNQYNEVLSPEETSSLIEELNKLGFRKSHAEEAAEMCRDREEMIEWLLIHVPEDDLPSWCLPENYSAGVQMVSSDMKRQAALDRLTASGFSREACLDAYTACMEDEQAAAQRLQDSLLGIALPPEHDNSPGIATDHDYWDEEQMSLSAIYADRYRRMSAESCCIELDTSAVNTPVYVIFIKPQRPYPQNCPVVSIDASLPAYIRLSITKKVATYAYTDLVGTQMIFSIIDWIESNLVSVIERPGTLMDLSGIKSPTATTETTHKVNTRSQKGRHRVNGNNAPGSAKSKQLLADWQQRQLSSKQKAMTASRRNLPAWAQQEAIVSAVNSSQITIISGETGSGKSTQSVQFVLDHMIQRELGEHVNIICTQPRRISALGLADRVSEERCSEVGREIGYSIRGESRLTAGITKCTFMTTGVLLRRLQSAGRSANNLLTALEGVSHIFLDEVHERDLNTDFLLALLRDVLQVRKDLKLILMSATVDIFTFEKYFGGCNCVAKLEISGRTFEVHDYYLDDVVHMTNSFKIGTEMSDDVGQIGQSLRNMGFGINYDLITDLVERIDEELGHVEGGILIFLSGTMEITRAINMIQKRMPAFHILPLHASLLPAEQRRVFLPLPPGKRRRVIASTNVAETSITIPDIVAVIDSGKVKETRYDPDVNMVKLEETWVSRAAAKQRRGRAGRVQEGKCYKLYTRNVEADMAERPDPEIKRTPLEQLVLSIKAMGIEDVPRFVASTLTPPKDTAVQTALDLLQKMGALRGNNLTALGRHMSMIPADLRCAKLMVLGTVFDLLEPCVTIAAVLSVKSPFASSREDRDKLKEARSAFGAVEGDIMADLKAYDMWSQQRVSSSSGQLRSWCEQNFLSPSILRDINSTRAQLLDAVVETGLIKDKAMSRGETSKTLLKSLILSALFPQALRVVFPNQKYQATVSGTLAVDPESREIKYFDSDNRRAFIHPSSTLFSAQLSSNNSSYMSYFNKITTTKPFVRELTPCGSYGLLLFGGRIEVDTQGRGLLVDGWIRLRGWARIGVLIGRLRQILDDVLARWVEEPGSVLTENERNAINVVKRLVELEGMDN